MTQAQAATAAGVSDTTWNQVETGKAVSERSLAKVSHSLWGDASRGAAILAGAESPPPAEPPPWEELLEGQRRVTAALERLADRLERRQ